MGVQVEDAAGVAEGLAANATQASQWPDPIPDEWKSGRASNAQAWFDKARDAAEKRCQEAEQKTEQDRKAQVALQKANALQQQAQQAFKQLQARTRAAAEALIRRHASAVALSRTPPEHLLRFPHHAALRPLVLLDSPLHDAPFPQQLLVRGVVSTLLANMCILDGASTAGTPYAATPQPASDAEFWSEDGSWAGGSRARGLQGYSELLQPGCGGTDILWWGPVQPHSACDDLGLARLEALWRCRVCVLVLSSSLVRSPSWADDRQVLAARLLGQPDGDALPLSLVVVRLHDSPHSQAPELQLPSCPEGAATSTHITLVDVPFAASPLQQVLQVVECLRPILQDTLGVSLGPSPTLAPMPEQAPAPEPTHAGITDASQLHLSFTPAAAIRSAMRAGCIWQPASQLRNRMFRLGCDAVAGPGAPPFNGGSSFHSHASWESSGQQLGLTDHTLGATRWAVGQDPCQMEYGASWVVAHSLGRGDAAVQKPLGQWCVDDVDAWIRRQGAVVSPAAPVLLRYGVDGQLLQALQPQHLAGLLGQPPWLNMLTGAITELQQRHGIQAQRGTLQGAALPLTASAFTAAGAQQQQQQGEAASAGSSLMESGAWRPGVMPGADDPLLITSSTPQLEQRFMEVMRFYDADCTGDLDAHELHTLLTACGIDLGSSEVATVLREYDRDKDGRLSRSEFLDVMWDVGRLLLASRDCTAWNVPCMTTAGSSGVLRRHLLQATHSACGTEGVDASSMAGVSTEPSAAGTALLAARSLRDAPLSCRSSIRTNASSQHTGTSSKRYITGDSCSVRGAKPVNKRCVHIAVAASPAAHSSAMEHPAQPTDGAPTRARVPGRGVSFAHHNTGNEHEARPDSTPEASLAATAAHHISHHQHHHGKKGAALGHTGASHASAGGGLSQAALQALGESHRPGGLPWGDARSRHASMAAGGLCDDDGNECGAAADGLSCCSSKHALTVATDLDVFADPLLLLSTTQLRDSLEPQQLAATLSACLTAGDLQRLGSLTATALRSSLTTGLAGESSLAGGGASLRDTLCASTTSAAGAAGHTSSSRLRCRSVAGDSDGPLACLSPAELQLVATRVLEQQLHHAGRPGHSGGGDDHVSISSFVAAAVEAVAASQQQLVEVVYGATGTQRLLSSLYAQMYPAVQAQLQAQVNGSAGAAGGLSGTIASLAGVGSNQNANTSTTAVASVTSSTLASSKVPFDAAPALLDVVMAQQQLQGAVPLLVKVGILQEAAAAGERCAGSGMEVDAWSGTAAHMLHVWRSLRELVCAWSPSYKQGRISG